MGRLHGQVRGASPAEATAGPLTSQPSSLEAGHTTRLRTPLWRWQEQTFRQFKVELKASDMALTGRDWAGQLGLPSRSNRA